jgi:hypothetical protein
VDTQFHDLVFVRLWPSPMLALCRQTKHNSPIPVHVSESSPMLRSSGASQATDRAPGNKGVLFLGELPACHRMFSFFSPRAEARRGRMQAGRGNKKRRAGEGEKPTGARRCKPAKVSGGGRGAGIMTPWRGASRRPLDRGDRSASLLAFP